MARGRRIRTGERASSLRILGQASPQGALLAGCHSRCCEGALGSKRSPGGMCVGILLLTHHRLCRGVIPALKLLGNGCFLVVPVPVEEPKEHSRWKGEAIPPPSLLHPPGLNPLGKKQVLCR